MNKGKRLKRRFLLLGGTHNVKFTRPVLLKPFSERALRIGVIYSAQHQFPL